mgnify:CR=1 FL=1
MIINKKEWLSERAEEALLYIGSGSSEIAAFCQPCGFDAGDNLSEPLVAVSVKQLQKEASTSNEQAFRVGDTLAHSIVATVVDCHMGIVTVDDVTIDVDDALPGDIKNGDRVTFDVNRLDVIE